MCERASISKPSLIKVEKGDPGAQMSLYASVLFVLGMSNRLADLADVRHDEAGLALEEEYLPERIRLPRRKARDKE
jgi:hypothetical protein